MCEYCDRIKKAFDSDLSDEEKLKWIEQETAKESIITFLYENEDLGVSYESLGLTEEDVNNAPQFEIDEQDLAIGRESFKKEKFARVINLYKYDSNAYGARGYGKNSRQFCITLATRTRASFMRYQDILRLNGSNPGLGAGGSNSYSVFLYRGGKNCKHFWTKYYYDTESRRILTEAPKSDQPKQIDKGSVGAAPED